MASRKSFLSKPSHIFPATSESETKEGVLEFDEADMWNLSSTADAEAKKAQPTGLKRSSRKVEAGGRSVMKNVASTSLPLNIPDWSKILKEDYKGHHRKRDNIDEDVGDGDESDHDQEGGIKIPPHEYLARTREASHSVHEGRGRTLKGRDLRSVRNAIWKKVGFED